MQNDSAVHGCFLDASKAFDLVNHEILFKRLMDRKLPTPVLRLLMAWYQEQCMRVKWNQTLPEPFSVCNGVRKGGVLSPILFTVYRITSNLTDTRKVIILTNVRYN